MNSSSSSVRSIEAKQRGWPIQGAKPEFTSYDELTAFEEQIASLEPELRRFAARKVRSEAIDDLLQDVWVAAWQALPRYDRRSSFRTWIYGICVHKCHDRYRSQRNESRLVSLHDLTLVDEKPPLENTVIQADTVNRLLEELDENHRVVLELYYYAQLTLAEIATILDRNLNTVKYQFYRAHAALVAIGEQENLL